MPQYSISIKINNIDYTENYIPKSLVVNKRDGTDRTSFDFDIQGVNLVAPSLESIVTISQFPALSDADIIVSGIMKRVPKQHIASKKTSPVTEENLFTYSISCDGYVRLLERMPTFIERFINKTTGFIIRDVMSRVQGIDISLIPITGKLLPIFEVKDEKYQSILERLTGIEAKRWWVDDTKKLHTEAIGDSYASFEINEANVRQICGSSLIIEPDTSNLANQIKLKYEGKYSTGTVNVSNAANEITGIGTKWKQDRITEGAKFRLSQAGNKAVYTVEKVLSDTNIRLSSVYAESSLSSQQYFIEGSKKQLVRSDSASIAAMSMLTGDDGVFADTINIPSGVYFSNEEAQDYLLQLLNNRANPVININFKTSSDLIPLGTTEGQTMVFDLPLTWGLTTQQQVKQITYKDTGAKSIDGKPIWAMDFKFEQKLYDLSARLRELELSQAGVTDSNENLDEYKSADDIISFIELGGVLTGITEQETINIVDIDPVSSVIPFQNWNYSVTNYNYHEYALDPAEGNFTILENISMNELLSLGGASSSELISISEPNPIISIMTFSSPLYDFFNYAESEYA
jgi:hypothetical protein